MRRRALQAVVDGARNVTEIPEDPFAANPAQDYRRDQFFRMGFDWVSACTLSNARDGDGFFLRWQWVELQLTHSTPDVLFALLT